MLKHIRQTEDWNEKSLSAKGFTLIELLVVIVILGVLAAVVVFSVSGITNDSQDSACSQEQRTLETAIEAFRAQNTDYPPSLASLSPDYLRDSDPADLAGAYTYVQANNGSLTQTACPKPAP